MLAIELLNAMIAKLDDAVTEVSTRVVAVPSRNVIPEGWRTPIAAIVYRGSDPIYRKGVEAMSYRHRFTVYLVDTIWQEQAVVLGLSTNQIGLLNLLHKAVDALRADRFQTVAALERKIGDVTITSFIGTEDYLNIGWFGASVGFEIEYFEGE